MPMTFPAHQGLILPVVRRWPNFFDALALSVGAAMPDITDTILGFPINGYFKQWYGHSLIGIFTLDFFCRFIHYMADCSPCQAFIKIRVSISTFASIFNQSVPHPLFGR